MAEKMVIRHEATIIHLKASDLRMLKGNDLKEIAPRCWHRRVVSTE
jgi:hypothetical protein